MSSVRSFYSGIEGDQHFNAAVEAGAVHVLTSYYYMREKNDMDILKRRHQRHPHLRFMIDSGAHSFQIDKAGKFHKWSMTDWENYLEAYTDWLRANKQHVFSAVELDIESVVKSQAIIEKWQDKYFRPLEEEGIDIIYVWHPQLGFEYWEKMCAKHAYVGLPGELSKEANFNSYFTVARKWVNKIHGFAATRQADYRDWPWYSIDSTSWKASEIYGLLMHWDDRRQKISYIEDKAKRAMFRRDFEKYGLDAEAIIRCGIHPNPHATEEEKKAYNRRSYMHITKYALITFRRMEAFYEERYKDNTQYYEMRLPHPKFLLQRIDRKQATKVWERWRPKDLFAQHAEETDPGTIRKILFGLACVQYQRLDLLGPVSRAFLQTYFASHLDAKPVNSAAVALDLALRSAPPNPQPIRRESAEDFADSAFTLHKRELSDWGELDYGPEDFPDHLLSLLTND